MSVPLILLHGIGAGAAMFDGQVAGLGDRNVQAWNMPGYGGRTLDGMLTFERLCEELSDHLDTHDCACADIFGHSIGGMLAMEFALRHPHRVRSLILCCTTSAFGSRDGKFQEEFVRTRLDPLDQGATMRELAPAMVKSLVGPDCPADARERARAVMAEVPDDSFRAAIHCLVTFDRRTEIAGLRMPVQLIAGASDRNAPPQTMSRMAEKIPDARIVILDGGHLLPVEQPELINRVVREFLVSCDERQQ